MEVIIKKAKIKNRALEVELTESYESESGGDVLNEVTKKCSQLCHNDMLKALDDLRPHLIIICETAESNTLHDVLSLTDFDFSQIDGDMLKNVIVTGFVRTTTDASEGVMIIGQKKVAHGKILNLVSPFILFEDPSAPYIYETDLKVAIDKAVSEVGKYLDGKVANEQLKIDFDQNFDAEVVVTEKKKRGRKKADVMNDAELEQATLKVIEFVEQVPVPEKVKTPF